MKNNIEKIYEQFRDNHQYLRNKFHYSQSSITKELGTTQSNISMIENGKRRPDFEYMVSAANLFQVELKDMLFQSFRNQDSYKLSLRDAKLSPILKCCNHQYYIYYVNDDDKIQSLILDIGDAISSHSAQVSSKYEKGNFIFNGTFEMDETYAYFDYQDYKRDFFIHLIFDYGRKSMAEIYNSGLGMLIRTDKTNTVSVGFCAITSKQIPSKYMNELKRYLNNQSNDLYNLRLMKAKEIQYIQWMNGILK